MTEVPHADAELEKLLALAVSDHIAAKQAVAHSSVIDNVIELNHPKGESESPDDEAARERTLGLLLERYFEAPAQKEEHQIFEASTYALKHSSISSDKGMPTPAVPSYVHMRNSHPIAVMTGRKSACLSAMVPCDVRSESYIMTAPGEGMHTRQGAWGGTLPQRSKGAVVGVGLLLNAVLSVGAIWLVLGHSRVESEDVSAGTEPLAVNEGQFTGDGQLTGEGPRAMEAAEPGVDQRRKKTTPPAPSKKASAVNQIPTVGEPASAKQLSYEVHAKPAAKAASTALPKGMAWVIVASSTGYEQAEVQIGSRKFKVSDRKAHLLVGKPYKVKWRKSQNDAWNKEGVRDISPGMHVVIHVSKSGLALTKLLVGGGHPRRDLGQEHRSSRD